MANELKLVSNVSGIVADLATIDSSYATSIIYGDDIRTSGNAFIWSSTGATNNGTVYTGLTGFWIMQFDGAVNVQWFGAVGNGTTNDLASINSALTAGKGGEVYMPQNNYGIGGGSIAVPSFTTLIGDGSDLTLITALVGTQYNTITNVLNPGKTDNDRNSATSIKLKGFKVDNTNATASMDGNQLTKGRCVEFDGVDGVVIEECIFTDSAADNVRLKFCTDYVIQKNQFLWSCRNRTFPQGWAGSDGLSINDIGYTAGATGFDIRDVTGGVVTGNYAAFNADVGFTSWGASNVIFTDNITKSNSQIQSNGAGFSLEGGAYGCKVLNNIVTDELKNGYGITRSTRTIFSGNSAFNCKANCIVGAQTSSTLISDNIFEYCGGGIFVFDGHLDNPSGYNENFTLLNNEFNYIGYLIGSDGAIISPGSSGGSTLSVIDAVYLQNGYNTIISANRIIGTYGNGLHFTKSASAPATLNATINSNTIIASGQNGIFIEYLASMYVTHNISKNNGQLALGKAGVVFTTSNNCTITDNDLSDDQSSHTQNKAYAFAGTCTNISINNNIVTGNLATSSPGNDILPILEGGTGLSTLGTGQLLRSNGPTLEYFTPTYDTKWLYSGFSSDQTITPGSQNQVVKIFSTGVSRTATLGPDSTTTSGTNKIFKNAGVLPLTVATGTGVTINGASGTFVLQAGSMLWVIAQSANTWQIVYSSEELGNAGVTHLIGKSPAVTVSMGAGLGTGGSVTFSGTDAAGTVTFTSGTTPTASAQVVRITFNIAYASAPKVVIGPSGANTATLYVTNKTTSYFDIYVGSTALLASTAYSIDYIVVQ